MGLTARFRSPVIAAAVAAALGAGFIVWQTSSSSDAVATDPSLAVADSGTTTGAEQATLFDATNTAPISMVGQTDSTVTTTWLPTEANLASTGSIVYPEGWTLQYTTNGTTWSGSAPGSLASVRGVRAYGDVSSFGLDGSGYQVSSNNSAGQLAAPVAFPPTPGGDGYSLTFTPTKALNVWHHQGSGTITIECHDRFTGLGCGTADSQLKLQISGGYGNTNNSLGAYNVATKKFYTAVYKSTNDSIGFLCADYSTDTAAACATPYVQMTGSGMGMTRNDLGASAFDGTAYNATKFYVVDAENDRLHCLDMTTGARCSNFTVDGFPIANHGDGIEGNWVSDISVIGGKVYYFAGNYFGCVDPSTNPPSNCDSSKPIRTITNKAITSNVATITTSAAHGFIAGDSVLVAGVDNTFNGVYTVSAAGTTTFTYAKTAADTSGTVTNSASASKNPTIALASNYQFPPIPIYNTSGVLQMACSVTTRECLTPAGASATFPATFGTWLNSVNITNAALPSAYRTASVGEWTMYEQKIYLITEIAGLGGFWANDAACWDFATNTFCPGGTNGVEYNVSTPGTLYAFVADPDEPCIWTVSDSDGIKQFGSNLVTCYPDSSVLFKYNETVPRMSCNEAGRVRLWQNMTITWTAGTLAASDIRVTVKNTDTGLNVPGWIQVPVVAGAGNTATLDLTSLAVSDTGTKPTFRVIGLGKIASDLAGLTAEIKYASDAPQVCLQLKPIACDVGLVAGTRYNLLDFTVTTGFNAVGPASSTQTKTAVGTGGSMLAASCATGALTGGTTKRSGGALPGAPVRLVHPRTGAVIAETVADINGNFSFPTVIAGTYSVQFMNKINSSPTGEYIDRWEPITGLASATVPSGGTGVVNAVYRFEPHNSCFDHAPGVGSPDCGGGGGPAAEETPAPVAPAPPPGPERVTDASEGSRGTGDMPAPAPLPADLDNMKVKPQQQVVGPTGGVVKPVPQSVASQGGKVQSGSLVIWTGASWVKTFTDPNVGTWTVVGDEVQFVPMPGYTGDTTIWYRLTDSKGQSAMSTVTMRIRSAAMPKCSLPGAKQVAVTFDVYKYAVSQADRGRIKKVTRPGCSYVVVGFVQPDDQLSNDYSLSLNRAKAVAAQIRALEPTARITIVAGKRQIKQICDKADNRCVVVSLSNKKKA